MSYNEALRRAIEQGRGDFARTVNEVMARADVSTRMSPDGGIYRDYDSMSAQQFLVEITNPRLLLMQIGNALTARFLLLMSGITLSRPLSFRHIGSAGLNLV